MNLSGLLPLLQQTPAYRGLVEVLRRDPAAGENIMMERIPSITPGVGSVLASNPMAIKPKVTTALRMRIATLMAKLCRAIVKARMLTPVFHSP